MEEWFEKMWLKYPRRLGKKDALRHYKASVKTEQDQLDLQQALFNFTQKLKKDRTEEQFIPYGSTWFNNWRDWIDYKSPTERLAQNQSKKPAAPLEEEISDADREESLRLIQELKSKLKGVARI